ncbi:CoA transferase, partial [Chloroflexota bacterium]
MTFVTDPLTIQITESEVNVEMANPLQGIRVVDCSHWYVGPEAASLLGDMGAEVIHVEPLGSGEMTRGMLSLMGVSAKLPNGGSAIFLDHNRNKKSLALDLKKAEGREIIYRLVKKSDVFITNFRRPAVVKLGITYETLSGINQQLVYGF